MDIDFEKLDRSLEQARTLEDTARRLEEEARNTRHEARRIRNETLGAILPFKVGDIVEYEDRRGFPSKSVVYRMKVTSLTVSGEAIYVEGARYTKKLEPSGIRGWFRIPQRQGGFVRVVKAAK